jgi:integrase
MTKSRSNFGSVRKLESGMWQARYTHPHTKARISAPITYKYKADAYAWLAEQQSAINQGTWKDTTTSRSTLGDYGLSYISNAGIDASTRQHYLCSWRVHVMPQLGSLAINDLTSERVRQWRDERLTHTGAYAVKHAYAVLRIVMNVALADNIIRVNPCNKTNRVQLPQRPKRDPLTPAQVAELVSLVPEHYRTLTLVQGWIGMRLGETCALRLSDLSLNDPDNATVRIQRRVYRLATQELDWDTPKTAASNRLVSIPPPLVSVIQQHISNAGIVDPDALVFTTQIGTCAITAASKAIKKALEQMGLGHLRAHDLRHTAGTTMTNNKVSMAQVMQVLGHSTVDAAMRYQHATAAAGRDVAHQIGDAIVLPDNVLQLVRKAS